MLLNAMEILAAVITMAGILGVIHQIRIILQHGVPDGVSLPMVAASATAMIAWCIVAILRGWLSTGTDFPVLLANLPPAIGNIILCYLIATNYKPCQEED